MTSYSHLAFVTLLFLFSRGSYAQNLVVDPGFEDTRECPAFVTTNGYPLQLKHWWLVSRGTSDVFNKCNEDSNLVSVPRNLLGWQQPLEGDGYAGICMNRMNYREYLQAPLSRSLTAGRTYHVSFYVSLGEKSDFAMSHIGLAVSKHWEFRKGIWVLRKEPLIECTTVMQDTAQWVKIEGDFVAEGGERFIQIGCFRGRGQREIVKQQGRKRFKKPWKQVAYYFVDMVEVVETDVAPREIESDGPIFCLPKSFFKPQTDTLTNEAKEELSQLYEQIKDLSANYFIEGHMISMEKESKNRSISKRRARSVQKYLIELGLSSKNIKYKAYGSSSPISRSYGGIRYDFDEHVTIQIYLQEEDEPESE